MSVRRLVWNTTWASLVGGMTPSSLSAVAASLVESVEPPENRSMCQSADTTLGVTRPRCRSFGRQRYPAAPCLSKPPVAGGTRRAGRPAAKGRDRGACPVRRADSAPPPRPCGSSGVLPVAHGDHGPDDEE